MGGHGYSVVHATSEFFEIEFVCIPRPLERSERPDGGTLAYRVRLRTADWKSGDQPRIQVKVLEGDPKFSL
jgi:alkaline phosphatase D